MKKFPGQNSGLPRQSCNSKLPTLVKFRAGLLLTRTSLTAAGLILLAGDVSSNPGPVFSATSEVQAENLSFSSRVENYCNETCPEPNSLAGLTKMKGVNIFHQNIRGLFGKMANLSTVFELGKDIDTYTLSETHIVNNSKFDNDKLYQIPGYHFVKKNRPSGQHGGVAAYISNKLQWKERPGIKSESLECIWIEIFPVKAKSFLVGCIYRPPDSSLYHLKDFNKLFECMLSIVNELKMETILMGDMNINYLKKSDHQELKDIINIAGLKQIIDSPTRVTTESSTLIDIILTNSEQNIAKWKVVPLSLSDHDCVGCVRKLNNRKYTGKTIKIRNYSNYNSTEFCKDINAENWHKLYLIQSANEAWAFMEDMLMRNINKHAPIIEKWVKGRFCPWLSPELKNLMNTRDKLHRKARKTNTETDWIAYKQLKNRCNNAVKQAKYEYHRNLQDETCNNPKKFWRVIKNIFPKASSKQTSLDEDCTTDTKTVANKFCKFFSTMAFKLKQKSMPLRNFTWGKPPAQSKVRTNKQFEFTYVSKIFVEKQLKALKRGKSPGHDNIPPGILKDAASELATPLSYIINLSLRTGVVPSKWKIAKVTPIHKSGPTSSFDNYRPISALPILSKILGRAAHKQLTEFLESNKLSRNQFGYRKRRSTEYATALFTDNIRKEADTGNLVGAIFVDLSKAFDTLSHSILLVKLESYGIVGIEHKWFSDYLFQRKQVCSYKNTLSDEFALTCGVPQGSILGQYCSYYTLMTWKKISFIRELYYLLMIQFFMWQIHHFPLSKVN